MKNLDREELDEFFKTGLTLPEVSEVDEDWDRMKTILLKKDKRNKVAYYVILLASVAAVLLVIFSVLFYSDITGEHTRDFKTNTIKKLPQSKAPEADVGTGINSDLNTPPKETEQLSVVNHVYSASKPAVTVTTDPENYSYSSPGLNETIDTFSNKPIQPAAPEVIKSPDRPAESIASSASADLKDSIDTITSSKQRDIRRIMAPSKSRFSLALTVSPDFSGVNSLQKTQIGYSVGASLMYNLSEKLGIETGIAYGNKAYGTDFSNYKPASSYIFPVNPYEVDADCRVLDLQLNMAYKLLNKSSYSLGFGAGVSSYIMLHESYAFEYENPASRGPRRYNVENQNKHYFGVANVNLSYQRKLTNNINLAFSPYLKLPLADIGYGNVRLKSAGVSIGVITNFNKSKK